MPLKYLAGQPGAVMTVGMAHGILWILYLLAAGHAAYLHRWPANLFGWAVIASVLPLGPFLFERHLRARPDVS